MVLHSCAYVYLYASNVATYIADHFASFYVYVIKNIKWVKIDLKVVSCGKYKNLNKITKI